MAERTRLVALRRGGRSAATRLTGKLSTIFDDDTMEPIQKIHELECKLAELNARYETLNELDQQILLVTDEANLQAEVEATDVTNGAIEDARALAQFRINTLKRDHEETNPAPYPTPALPNGPSRATSRPKIALPRFNGDILQWQPFWQAFDAEIESDNSLANINKFNYLVGQLDSNVLVTVAGLTPSNENYAVLVDLLRERFGRKPKIIAAYMRALYTLQKPEGHLKSLRSFYDLLESYVRGLESLGKPPDTYGDLLVCILLDKLPGEVRKNVARQHDQDEFTLDQLRNALKGEIRVMEAGQSSLVPANNQQLHRNFNPKQSTTMFNGVSGSKPQFQFPCAFCGAEHSANSCNQVPSVEERRKIVLQKHLCYNCLSSKHQKKDCRSKVVCKTCQMKHHSSLHQFDATRSTSTNSVPTTVTNAHFQTERLKTPRNTYSNALNVATQSEVVLYPFVFLKTAIVKARSPKGELKANLMFDEGAQRTWTTWDFAKRLGLHPTTKELLITSGFGNSFATPRYYEVVEFCIVVTDGTSVRIRAIVIDYLVSPLDDKYRKELYSLPHLKNLNLAHPYTGRNVFKVDILIGADHYWHFIGDDKPVRGQGPTAVNSRVGYLVSGALNSAKMKRPSQSISLNIQAVDADDCSYLWSLETLGIFPHQENMIEAAEYAKRSIQFNNGQYIARFPWKMDHGELPTNYKMVQNMTRAIIKRLHKDGMLSVVATLIKEQLDSRFIERVPPEQLSRSCHYIPYHFVKKASSTTPIRIVYNCSNKGWNGVSFNDCVETGAPLQNDQIHLLLRFRTHAIGMVADVEKAFHHIELHESDRDFLRWMWLEDSTNPDSPLVVYRFKVVPFGAKSSPFILNSVIMHHLNRNASAVAKNMQQSVFVDNIITGCESETEIEEYFRQANEIMCSANLPLQAWGFSNSDVERRLGKEGKVDPLIESKTLGLIWNRDVDYLHVQVPNIASVTEKTTKRDVLKGTGSFYDPLGFYAPLATSAKILIQDLCIKKAKLDEPVEEEHLKRWGEIVSSIVVAVKEKTMSVRRSYFGAAAAVQELHVFCDASRRAYGAVAYFVHQTEVAFVEAKVRITPIKNSQREGERELSIPEAELMAAYLGVLIASNIISALEPNGIKVRVFLWSDSQIVHFWISKGDGHPRQFVTNRVKKIREFNKTRAATWKYVPSAENPADILSRGASLKEFQASKLWEKGPEWLVERKLWPTWSVCEFKNSQTTQVAVQSVHSIVPEEDIFQVIEPNKYSWEMLLRVTARVFRLLANLRLKDPNRNLWNRQPLKTSELQEAEDVWIRAFQKKHLLKELDYLKAKKKSWRPALVSQLDLFLDTKGIIRSKGRLQNAAMVESAKHPVLIPKDSLLARLIITSVHERIFHYGVESTLSHLIQRYWIPSARSQIKRVYRACVKCRRDSGPSFRLPDPAPLPANRIRENYPFAITGVDYTGAIPIRQNGGEGSAYILLFTCGTTRAIHLEAVEDMTAGSFIDAMRRFTGHHPIPRLIYSDNATTFLSVSNILVKLFSHPDVTKELANMRTTWKFIPKRAPWYGGWWERLIALTKTSLRKMVGKTKLRFIQLQTIIAQIEAILNDRPLTRVPTNIDSFDPLTPSHLLYGRRLLTLPFHYEAEEENEDPSYGKPQDQLILLKSYLKTQNVLRSFWRSWNTVYLPSLREHHQKTRGPIEEIIKIGDVVQIHTDEKRSQWKLAVVQQLNRGADGLVRSAEIRTANGKTNRPINKLYPLEVWEPTEEVLDNQGSRSVPAVPDSEEKQPKLGKIQREAARQAVKNIRLMARMDTIQEDEE